MISLKSRPILNQKVRLVSLLFNKLYRYFSQNISYLKTDPNFFLMKYMGRFIWFRDWVYHLSLEDRHATDIDRFNDTLTKTSLNLSARKQVLLDHDLVDAIQKLQQDGYYTGLRLSSAHIEGLISFAFTNPCYGDRNPNNPLLLANMAAVQRQDHYRVASYLYSQENCQVVQDLKHDPVLRTLAKSYLGKEPVYFRSDLLWSFPKQLDQKEKISAAQVFHCDINDYRSVKFFFYLTNVECGDGSHSYIKGTHRRRSIIDQLLGQRLASKQDEKLIQSYGEENIRTVYGSAGLGFAGDPYCIHRGDEIQSASRLLFQVEYGLYQYRTYYSFHPFPKST